MAVSPLDTLQGAEEYKKSILDYVKEKEADILDYGKKMPKALEKASKKGDWSDVKHLNHMIEMCLRTKSEWEAKLPDANHHIRRAGWLEAGHKPIVDFLERAFQWDMRWYRGLVKKYGANVMTSSERIKLINAGEISKIDSTFALKTIEEAERSFRLDMRTRYESLVKRVETKAGKIVNATGLHINEKGGIDGIVECEDGDVHVQTIPASGEIQRFHYRTLVKVAKTK
ncbi:hypothetical protein [Bacillus thuringiensis]|uniref:hypothetical protein n=1 Tax=Bacillus thuringiensis TaxID=1428 RepID=UPI000BFD1F27|nr:hypothetical protein [Bacillus thuringiensis]PGT90007.1 hypothetical protein COD17_09665 [Bacillus thuringiensis]